MAETVLAKMAVEISANAAKFNAAVAQTNTQIGGLQKSLTSANRFLSSFGVGFSAIAIVQGLRSVISVSSDFERTMSEVRAITGATGKEFEALKKNALDLGASTKFSSKQVGELQIALGRLGFTTSEILEATEATLSLAAATGEDLAKAADTAGSTVRGFGLSASETQRVVDVMAKSFNTTALGLDNFTESMKYVAPIAAAANVSVEETTALLGVLADAGIRGSSAGTALRKIFGDLSKDGRPVLERLQELSKKGLGLSDAFDEVGRTAQTALLVLSKNNDKANELAASFQNVSGEAEAMARIMQDNLSGDVEKLSSAWEGLILSLSKSDVIRSITQNITGMLNALGGQGNDAETLMRQLVRAIQGGSEQATKGFVELLKEVRYEAGKPFDLRFVNELTEKYGLTSAQAALLKKSLEEVNTALGFQETSIKQFNEFAERNGFTDLKLAADAYIKSLNESIVAETNRQQKLRQLNVDTDSDIFSGQADKAAQNIENFQRVIEIIKDYTDETKPAAAANESLAASEDKVAKATKRSREERIITVGSLEYYRDLLSKLNKEFEGTAITDSARRRQISAEITGVEELIKRYERIKDIGFELAIPAPETKGLFNSLEIDKGLTDRFKERMKEIVDTSRTSTEQIRAEFEGLDLSGLLSSALYGIGEAFGDAMSGTADFGKALLSVFGGVLKQFGSMLITVGAGIVAASKAFKSLNGYVAIAAGVALVALGSYFAAGTKALGNSIGGGSRGGSASTGGGSERLANSQRAEQIILVQVEGKIRGNELLLVQKNQQRQNERTGG